MGRWRQPLSVKAQAALSLSLPGREDHKEREKHTHGKIMWKHNVYIQTHKSMMHVESYRDPQSHSHKQ